LKERDNSKLLIYDGKTISSGVFRNMDKYITPGSLLVFNNTRVIRARLLFQKKSGANIEILCLEPLVPTDYEKSFGSTDLLNGNASSAILKNGKPAQSVWISGRIVKEPGLVRKEFVRKEMRGESDFRGMIRK
jgi:S-adenosylmethionine:tRNA ribosyltransferase-isomerase